MLRKMQFVFMALACAAAFTFVSAQLPWEAGAPAASEPAAEDESSSGAEVSSEPSSSEESSYESASSSDESSSSESSYSSVESSSEEAAEEVAEAAPASEKPKKEKKEKAAKPAKERTAAAGFSTQKSCPVCNTTRIKKNLFVESDGGNLHVCSLACIGRVSRNPGKFTEILEARGEGPEK